MNPLRRGTPPESDGAPRGFSLLEVLVALGILGIVLLAVFRLQAQALSMNLESRFYTLAPHLARSVLIRFEQERRLPLAGDEGDFGSEFPGYRWKLTVEPHASRALGAEISSDLRRIEVQVSLDGERFRYGLRTYRFWRE
ncbi:MAG: prepilin-type N-terminal cleavage/methylation domain-containing protein [Desulfobacterales bacterium]